MKIILSFFVFSIFFLNNNNELIVTGSWTMCKSGDTNGIEVNRNVCSKIDIKSYGKGNINDNYLNFEWKIKDKTILFSFDTEEEKSFFGNTTQFKFENYHDEKFLFLKLIDESGNWYLLVKSNEY